MAARLLARSVPGGERPADGFRRILVIRQDNRLGNLILLTPFLQRLREVAGGARIGLLCGQVYAALLQDWPWVDDWIVQEKRRHARSPWLFLPWVAGVRRGGWDLALEASNHNTHSYYNCLMALACGAPARIGFDHPRSRAALTRTVPAPDPTLHFSLAPLALLRALGWAAPAATMACPLREPPSERFRVWRAREGVGTRPTVIHLGGRNSKAWPTTAWASLLPRITESAAGPVVLVAGADEQDRLAFLHRLRAVVPAPEMGVADLAHLLHGASGFIGCDTGVMHLAVALGTPTVALFFRSNPYHYAPLGGAHRTVLLADPYGVEEEVWGRSLEGLRRSPLSRAESAPEASRLGIPAQDARAAEAVASAWREVAR